MVEVEQQTDLFGIPIPSTDRVFLTFVIIHILISLGAVVSGFIAMLSEKKRGNHTLFGKIYLWTMLSSFATVVILSIMRWPHNVHLLLIGAFASGFAFTGYRLSKSQRKRWTRLHTVLMGFSYVLLLTGFYVDNGKHLPFWNQVPQIFFWFFPSAAGIPIILRVLLRHPLNRQ